MKLPPPSPEKKRSNNGKIKLTIATNGSQKVKANIQWQPKVTATDRITKQNRTHHLKQEPFNTSAVKTHGSGHSNLKKKTSQETTKQARELRRWKEDNGLKNLRCLLNRIKAVLLQWLLSWLHLLPLYNNVILTAQDCHVKVTLKMVSPNDIIVQTRITLVLETKILLFHKLVTNLNNKDNVCKQWRLL